ncbi:MAG: hypothetical protein NVS1B4_02460 [Gemmatimonadaceae bacterium]
MLINLIPDFLAVLSASDPAEAYYRYFESHRRLLEAYWHNYVVDPGGPHFAEVARGAALADRTDLRAALERVDVVSLARATEQRCTTAMNIDVDVDVVLMVGVGGANAGELVIGGRGIAFICLEHFTSIANPATQGLGLDPELVPLWLAHEIAHVVRYTSPTSQSELQRLIAHADGYYSYWETGRHATLRELVINEGLAVLAAQSVSPGHAPWEYFGYERRQYARIRELEAIAARAVSADFDHTGLGLRLRYLSGGMSDEARTIDRYVLPERVGYYLGTRMAEAAVAVRGLPWALRATAEEIEAVSHSAAAIA